MRKIHFIFTILMTLLLLGTIFDAHAIPAKYTAYPTDTELSTLPPYCRIKLRYQLDSPEYKSMLESFGPDFLHVHHHCAGLNFINRYYRTSDAADKTFYLQSALTEFGYMVSHAKSEFSLMPDVYLNQAITYSLLKNNAMAINSLDKAISLNPKFTRAYSLLADYQIGLKQGSKALDAVTEGLRQIPDSKFLQKRYLELGGILPYPEPYQKPEEQKAVAKDMGKEIKPGVIPEQEKPAIGMPGNPWCRFCPEGEAQKEGQTQAKP